MVPIQKFSIKDGGVPKYLDQTVNAYYSYDYYSMKSEYYDEENTGFINVLKNEMHSRYALELSRAKKQAEEILLSAIPCIMEMENVLECVCVAVPRSKSYSTYFPNQLYLIDAISKANRLLEGVEDGARAIIRHTNTRTTHLSEDTGRVTINGRIPKVAGANDGPTPYPGITKDTCVIDESMIKGKTVILIDDIYTPESYVDEDCIQAMYDMGAKRVVFYAFAKTKRGFW